MSSQVTQETIAAATAVVAQHGVQADPLLVGLAWLVGIVTLVIAIGKPIKDYLRNEQRADKADIVCDAKSSAEAVLYNHLAEQVTEYRRIADEAFRERNALISLVAALEAKATELEQVRTLTVQLQTLLSEKDSQLQALLTSGSVERAQFLAILQDRDSEIANLKRLVGLPRDCTIKEPLSDDELIG